MDTDVPSTQNQTSQSVDKKQVAPDVPAVQSTQTPKKYIRTFAGDMEAVKKGQKPNLKPLEKVSVSLPTSPQPTESTSIATKAFAPEALSRQESYSETTILPPRLAGHLSVPIEMSAVFQPPPKPEPPPPPQPPKPEPKPSPLQTYQNDFADKVKKTHATPVTVLAAEQDAKKGAVNLEKKESSHGVLYVISGLVLLSAGGAVAYYAYTGYLSKSAPVVVTPVVSAPIFVDQSEEISGEGSVLVTAFIKSVEKPLASKTVRYIYRPIITSSGESVFGTLQLPAPDLLLRNVVSASSMAGVIGSAEQGTGASPFFILTVTSYTDTFAAMLDWEPNIPRDLGNLFMPKKTLMLSVATTTATSTNKVISATTTQTFALTFHDEVIVNHDARVYRDVDGNEQFAYGYWNEFTLIIARDKVSFAELIGRLSTSRKQ